MAETFLKTSDTTRVLRLISAEEFDDFVAAQSDDIQAWITRSGFSARHGSVCVLPEGLALDGALVGLGSTKERARQRFALGAARAKLPDEDYHLQTSLTDEALDEQLLGWLLSGYRFDRYKTKSKPQAQLVLDDSEKAAEIAAIAQGECLTRDLINTPASDMGPAELEAQAVSLADQFGADCTVTLGEELLDQNFPMIHTVGRASDRAPRLIDMRWGKEGPTLTLVGKGVCFDTGGLNLKPGSSMGLMKKDMGGAATVLGLAHMIMATGLRVQLRVLIPAVENSVAGNAFRPQDILTSRKGLTVEINNTDAEGRLVLADALTYAQEENPDLIISMATLTGAARVAVGPDLAPFYASAPSDADHLRESATRVADPVWELPFWDPYEAQIEPAEADLDNAPPGGFAGSITAALFLRRFVEEDARYMHFDIYGWNPSAAPARPKGGVGQGARALLGALPAMLDL